jgi:hypothetical protein
MRLLRGLGEGLVPGTLLTRLFGSFNIMRRIDERDVGKSLRKIGKRGKSRGGGMIIRFSRRRESDSLRECRRPQTLMAFRTPI